MRPGKGIARAFQILFFVTVILNSCTKDSGPIFIVPEVTIDTIYPPPPPDTLDTTGTNTANMHIWDIDQLKPDTLPPPPPPNDTVSFANDILPMFEVKCWFCHPTSGNLDLGPTVAYNELVNRVTFDYAPEIRVVPFDTTNSVMYQKIIANLDYGIMMPPGGVTLTEQEIEDVGNWIMQGALDN